MSRQRKRHGMKPRDRDKFERDLRDQRRAKGLLTEPAESPGERPESKEWIFGPEDEAVPTPTRTVRDGQVFCPAGPHYVPASEMRTGVCYYHVRHPRPDPSTTRPQMVMPEGSRLGGL
jgi:hypothetical protein